MTYRLIVGHASRHRTKAPKTLYVVSNDLVLVLVVITALSFDFTNGFHDTGNAMATSIATKALRPRTAVGLSAVLNLVGAFLSLSVAATIASGLVDTGLVTLTVVFAGLAGAAAAQRRHTAYLGHAIASGQFPLLATLLGAASGAGSEVQPDPSDPADRYGDILARVMTGMLQNINIP